MSSNFQETNQLIDLPFYVTSNSDDFISQTAKLSKCYQGVEEILGIDANNPIFEIANKAFLVSEPYFDDNGVFRCFPLKENLSLELQQAFFHKLFEKWIDRKNEFIELDKRIKEDYLALIGFNPQSCIFPNPYALHEERLPDWVNAWISEEVKKGDEETTWLKYEFLTALNVYTPDTNIVKLRKYLENPSHLEYQASDIPNLSSLLKNTLRWASKEKLRFSGNDLNVLKIIHSMYEKILFLEGLDSNFPLLIIDSIHQEDITYIFENKVSVENYSYNQEILERLKSYQIDLQTIFEIVQEKESFLVNQATYPNQFDFENFQVIEIEKILDIDLLEESAEEIDEDYYKHWKSETQYQYTIKYYEGKIPYLLKFETSVVKRISQGDIDINEDTKTIYVAAKDKDAIDQCLQKLVNNSSFSADLLIKFNQAKSFSKSEIRGKISQEQDSIDKESLYEPSYFQKQCSRNDFDENRSEQEIQLFAYSLLSRLDQQKSVWKGYIYHFTHVENAASILNTGSLLSRGRLLSSFKDSAGESLIYKTRDKIKKDFARFYFRPKTPTQWHNELLGRREGGIKAICPVPIFLCFKIDDVLRTHKARCAVSNGNLATDWACYGNSQNFLEYFDSENVYKMFGQSSKYKTASQQEFIIKDGLEFLKSGIEMKVVCRNEQDQQSLLSLLGSDKTYEIEINPSYYNNISPYVDVDCNQPNRVNINLLHYNSGIDGKIRFNCNREITKIVKINSNSDVSVSLEELLSIESQRHISVTFNSQGKSEFKVFFVEDKQEWLIYQKI